MVRSRKMRFLALALVIVAIPGCTQLSPPTRFEASVKNAWMMYTQSKDDLGPPPLHLEEAIYARGKAEFVEHMTKVVGSKYRREALYSLGWFGDRRHASVVAKALTHEEPEVRRIATASLSRLVNRKFSDPGKASEWWSKHRSDFPRFKPDESARGSQSDKTATTQ